jgi:hypothetical protein
MRLPLVYATRGARAQAERLLPGRIIENLVERAILDGRVSCGSHGGYVFDPDGKEWVAEVKRQPSRLNDRRRAWVITAVRRYQLLPHERRR